MDPNFLIHFVNFWIYGISGILLMFVGFKLFDWFTPKIDFPHELIDNKNVAVGIMIGAIIIGVAIIAAAVIAS